MSGWRDPGTYAASALELAALLPALLLMRYWIWAGPIFYVAALVLVEKWDARRG